MDKDNKYYSIIENLVRKHRKFNGYEEIIDDIIDDVYSHSESIISSVDDESIIETYLSKVISTSIITVPKKLNFYTKRPSNTFVFPKAADKETAKEESDIIENNTNIDIKEKEETPKEEIQVDRTLVDNLINSAEPQTIEDTEPDFDNDELFSALETEEISVVEDLEETETKADEEIEETVEAVVEEQFNIQPDEIFDGEQIISEDETEEKSEDEDQIFEAELPIAETSEENLYVQEPYTDIENSEQEEDINDSENFETIETSNQSDDNNYEVSEFENIEIENNEEYDNKEENISILIDDFEEGKNDNIDISLQEEIPSEEIIENIELDTNQEEEEQEQENISLVIDENESNEISFENEPSESEEEIISENIETLNLVEDENDTFLDERPVYNEFSDDGDIMQSDENQNIVSLDIVPDEQNEENNLNQYEEETELQTISEDSEEISQDNDEFLTETIDFEDSENTSFDFQEEDGSISMELEESEDENILLEDSDEDFNILDEGDEDVDFSDINKKSESTPFDYSVFNYEPIKNNNNIDAENIQLLINNLAQENPELNIMEIYNLKYIQKMNISNIAEELQINQDDVVEALSKMAEII